MFSEKIYSHRLVGLAFLSGLVLMISQSGCKSSGTATTGPAGNASSLASKSADPLLNSGGAHADPARATANKSGYETQATTAESSSSKKD